jgi:hypothetical protein
VEELDDASVKLQKDIEENKGRKGETFKKIVDHKEAALKNINKMHKFYENLGPMLHTYFQKHPGSYTLLKQR